MEKSILSQFEEEDFIHRLLNDLLPLTGVPHSLRGAFNRHNVRHAYYLQVSRRLRSEGLIETFGKPDSTDLIALSPKGVEIARGEGGYLGFLSREQNKQRSQVARTELDTQANLATISAANSAATSARTSKSSALAAWVASIAAVISLGVSLWSLYEASQINELKAQLTALQQQLKKSTTTYYRK